MLSGPSAFVILVKAKVEVSKPLDLLFTIVLSSLWGNDTLEHDASILVKFISPVIEFHAREVYQVFWLGKPGDSLCFGG